MIAPLGPVRSLRDRFRQIYGKHLNDHSRASMINRIWTSIFGVLALSLGITFLVGCASNGTAGTHLVAVNSTQLVLDIMNNNTFVNYTSSDPKGQLLNTYQQTEGKLPEQYLFGMSGCCRVYQNGSTHCARAFPQDVDILTTFINDVNTQASLADIPGSDIDPASLVSPSFHSMQQSYINTSKAYTAIAVTVVVWALINTAFIMIFAHKSLLHLVGTIPGAILAVGSAGVATWCVILQMGAYELSENYAAISFGPGSFVMWAWMVCLLLLTPLTAMISLVVAISIFVLILYIILLFLVCVLACFPPSRPNDDYDLDRYSRDQDPYPQGLPDQNNSSNDPY